jgi:redox-sensitive bicupin YhaK (pirin superfamily)
MAVLPCVLFYSAHLTLQTVTFMLEGAFEHQDFAGHKGLIEAGDLQW